MKYLVLVFWLVLSSLAFAELPAAFDDQVDVAIARAEYRTDAKFDIEAYKQYLQESLAAGRAEFEKEYEVEIRRLTEALPKGE